MIQYCKITIVIVVALLSIHAHAAPPIKSVKGEYTYYGDKSTSPAECKRLALEGARLDALAKEFGTIVTQDIMQADRIDSNGESNKFLSLSSTEVKGEWIADDGEPEYVISLDKDDNFVVSCVIKGKAREISNEASEFDARVLRNGSGPQFASSEFHDGDNLYLYFSAPIDGFVSVFLSLEDGNVYQMIPYLNASNNDVKVKKGKSYIFFDPNKTEYDFGTPDQFGITTDGVIEFNKIYVLFSPLYFARPPMQIHADTGLPSMKESDFSKWLVKARRNDPKLGLKQMNLKIYPK